MKLKDKFDEGLYKEFRGIKTSTMKFYDTRVVGYDILFPYY